MGVPVQTNEALETAPRTHRLRHRLLGLWPGVLLCMLVAMAANFAHLQTGLPSVLLAVGFGMALPSLSLESGFGEGIEWCASTLLRFGVALMGVRLGLDQVGSAGPASLLLALLCIPLTIGFSRLTGRAFGLNPTHCLAAGAAVAICGVAAALAVIAALPRERRTQPHIGPIILGVTMFSTVAMVVYPWLAHTLNFSDLQTGLFLGGTIHDVAQVAGAGALMSDEVSELALFTKMTRVAFLAPVALIVAWWVRGEQAGRARFPFFLLGFVAMAALGNSGSLAPPIHQGIVDISGTCLLVTMASLGCKTMLSVLGRAGIRPMLHILLNTLFIAALGLSVAALAG
ncbi:putative sulfate exporter family transporter [Marinobacteraceae bacterium S3BR75-40.1]